ncbi:MULTISPECIES: hypothetical protein [unclassified Aeromicrobium]|uniref:helix-turn-helix transcriptional regulator n=1 Tax=unclassified Aeromicrobium TaxID=2633570 RepID=UPI00288BF58C|nr:MULTISPECIES: hypothetical protein [unclassified Aeromicrobium]
MTSEPDDLITASEAADMAKVDVETFRTYERRGYAPARVKMFGRTPVYSRAAVRKWLETRPGAGARTDLRRGDPQDEAK